jgi:hypothetical protein
VLTIPGCGGSSPGTPDTPVPTPTPTPTPAPTPAQPTACTLTAPTVDCSTRAKHPLENADQLEHAINIAMGTSGVMYSGENRIYDLDRFRSRTTEDLTAAGLCAVWDWGNEKGDEIFVRSADGCVAEQYDMITGEGGVRGATMGSNAWQEGFSVPVPGPKPNFSRDGDLSCSLVGDRSTFCFSIKRTSGEYGRAVYEFLVQVMNENPSLFDKNDFAPGQGDFIPAELRVAAWRILNHDGYSNVLLAKLRANGYCAYLY